LPGPARQDGHDRNLPCESRDHEFPIEHGPHFRGPLFDLVFGLPDWATVLVETRVQI
jgi:hypothetical protein